MSHENRKSITVGELRQALSLHPDDTELYFGGLEFYRVKSRGDKLAQIEFSQHVHLDSDGRIVVEEG